MRGIAQLMFAAALILLLLIPKASIAGERENQICDANADYYLGLEDYQKAARLHAELVRAHPDNALVHYHLGFALGMVGDIRGEEREYRRARALGLENWDLFLNLGLAQLENGDLDGATESIRHAVLLGEDHTEPHLNLALIEERRGMLADAEHETLAALRLSPTEPAARNLLGVIYVQQGNVARAESTWAALVRDLPDYEPARANLATVAGTLTVESSAARESIPGTH
jgi:Flp pilus assembly protein TadD